MLSLGLQTWISLRSLLPQFLFPSILSMNRNGRVPKKPNHGARPCSSVMRRLKVKESYRRVKPGLANGLDEWNK